MNVIAFAIVGYVLHLIFGSIALRQISKTEKESMQLTTAPPQPPVIIDKRPIIIVQPQPVYSTVVREPQHYLPRPDSNTYVSVVFKPNSPKTYDYFLGANYDVKVGDFVVVYVHDKFSNTQKRKMAQVVFISSRGDVSPYARSTIVEKSRVRKW